MTGSAWQFDLVWALADLHLSKLVEEDYLWEPAPSCWTQRRGVWARPPALRTGNE